MSDNLPAMICHIYLLFIVVLQQIMAHNGESLGELDIYEINIYI